jgi:hypothetical protein
LLTNRGSRIFFWKIRSAGFEHSSEIKHDIPGDQINRDKILERSPAGLKDFPGPFFLSGKFFKSNFPSVNAFQVIRIFCRDFIFPAARVPDERKILARYNKKESEFMTVVLLPDR